MDPKRTPGLDDEVDGLDCFATEDVVVIDAADDLDCFATEGVVVIDSADDAAALAEVPVLLPALRAPALSALPMVRTAARSALPVVRTIAQDMRRQLARGSWYQLLAAFALLQVGGMVLWLIEPVDRPATIVAASPAAPAPTPALTVAPAPMPAVAPRAQPAPPIELPVPQPPVARSVEPPRERPQSIARTAAPALAPVAPPPARRSAVPPAEGARPSSEAAARLAPALRVESPVVVPTPVVVATPEVVRAEPEAAAPRAAGVPAVVVPPTDRSSIERVLQTYQDAYDRLDASSAAVVWPRVDTRALNRAFSTLAEQDVSFDRCDLAITGAKANATCTGEIRYVRRVGDQEPRVRRVSWSFALERVSDRWQIAQVTAD